MKIYISGKITGLDLIAASDKFQAAAVVLREAYPSATIVNPMKLEPLSGVPSWGNYMAVCMLELSSSDTIYMLSNWEDSKGAKIEHFAAKTLELSVFYQTGGNHETNG